MAGLLLDKRASIWRMVSSGGLNQKMQAVYPSIGCAIVPISSFAEAGSFAYTSTHVLWVPFWLMLRMEDEVHSGRRDPDTFGNVGPLIYVINGSRRTTQGVPQKAYYVRLKD